MIVVEKMRNVLNQWMKETGGLGLIPEKEIMERMWPGGVQPKISPPVISPNGGTVKGSVRVKITCPTEGALIAYTTKEGDDPHWLLRTKEIKLTESTKIRSKVIRIGYAKSPEVQAEFDVE